MKIYNAKREFPDIEEHIASTKKFIGIIIIGFSIIGIISLVLFYNFFAEIKYPAELAQAVLICSTAIAGLSGLIVIDIKKSDISVPSNEEARDIFERTEAMNLIYSFVKADVFLRWCLFLSFITILLGCLQLVYPHPVIIIILLVTFIMQAYFFLWSLLLSDLLPSP